MTTASTIDLVSRRVLWLEGKNAELRPELAAVRSETDWATRTYGARPSGWTGSLQFLTPAGQNWNDLDQRLAARVGPFAANVRRAVASLQELQDQFQGAERGATPEQMRQLNLLAGRVNTAVSEGSRLYNQWVTYPAARWDNENVPLSERVFRHWVVTTGVAAGLLETSGVTAHEAWESTGAPVVEAVEEYEAEREQRSVFGQHQAPTSAPGGGKDTGGGDGAPGGNWWSRLGIRDKLAVVGVASIAGVALYTVWKVKRAVPFV